MGFFDRFKSVEELEKNRDIDGLIKATGRESYNDVKEAFSALGRLQDPRALEYLISMVRHRDIDISKWAVLAIGKYKSQNTLELMKDFILLSHLVFAVTQILKDTGTPEAKNILINALPAYAAVYNVETRMYQELAVRKIKEAIVEIEMKSSIAEWPY